MAVIPRMGLVLRLAGNRKLVDCSNVFQHNLCFGFCLVIECLMYEITVNVFVADVIH